MRALTIKQPWASLVMSGVKDVENRSWSVPKTLHCGGGVYPHFHPFRLWIHAGQSADMDALRDLPRRHDGIVFWRGVLLGSVLVTGCHPADECADFDAVTLGQCVDIDGGWWHKPTEEKPCHTVKYCSRSAEPDCYHWTLTDSQPLDAPVPMKGRQGLWTPDGEAVLA